VTDISTADERDPRAAGDGRGATRKGSAKERRGLFGRIGLFFRQVIAELRKVVRPTRSELITYTSVVLVFVAAVMAFVSVLDYGFGHLVLFVFGGGS
jgi:preprotein translocase subunit SecE